MNTSYLDLESLFCWIDGRMASKEAVCVIIDGNISMTKPARMPSSSTSKSSGGNDNDNDHGHGHEHGRINGEKHDNGNGNVGATATDHSRFDVAKGVAIDFISSLMIRSKTHEYVGRRTLSDCDTNSSTGNSRKIHAF